MNREQLLKMRKSGLIIAIVGAILSAIGVGVFYKAEYELGQLDQMVLE